MEESDFQETEKKRNNIILYTIIVGVIILFGIGIGYFLYKNYNNQKITDNNILDIKQEEKEKKINNNQEILNIGFELYKFATGDGKGPILKYDESKKITVDDITYTLVSNYNEVAYKFTKEWLQQDHYQFQ